MDNWTKVIIGILIVLFFGISFSYFASNKIKDSVDQNIKANIESKSPEAKKNISEDNPYNLLNPNNSKQISNSSSTSGGFGSGGDESKPILPENLNIESQECGYYFENYGVCGGKCSVGSCVSEGRSCYCKEL